jgi:hypothetical protein
MKHTLTAAALALACALARAHAADAPPVWYIFNAQARQCDPAPAGMMSSPASVERAARDEGVFRETEVERDGDGNIAMARVRVQFRSKPEPSVYVFFRSLQLCQKGAEVFRKKYGGAGELE